MRGHRGGGRWPTRLVVVVALAGAAVACAGPSPDQTSWPELRASSGAGAPSRTATATPVPTSPESQNPARFAAQVLASAGKAGINPTLLMAILYNESDKPHDPALERAWQTIKPDAAFGIANMHKAAFDEAKQGRDLANHDWSELPDNPDLAIEAAAWHLHDLAAQLPSTWSGPFTRDELLALGYNAGASAMTAFTQGKAPGPIAQSYLERLHTNWTAAEQAIHRA
ncbi:MAG: transglycosylase SLT domain-containing protein [Pseudonocardiaceae bacterium]